MENMGFYCFVIRQRRIVIPSIGRFNREFSVFVIRNNYKIAVYLTHTRLESYFHKI